MIVVVTITIFICQYYSENLKFLNTLLCEYCCKQKMIANSFLVCSLLLLLATSTVRPASITPNATSELDDSDAQYEDSADNEDEIENTVESLIMQQNICMCQNEGVCSPFNKRCTCKPGFTGMYCEARMNDGQDEELASRQCGHLLDRQIEYSRCAECTCERGILTCIGLAVVECNNLPRTASTALHLRGRQGRPSSSLSTNDFLRLKGSRITTTLRLIAEIEALAYQAYIEMHGDMPFVLHDLDDERLGDEIDRWLQAHVRSVQRSTTVLIALSSNKRLVGLQFRRIAKTSSSSHSSAAGLRSSSHSITIALVLIMPCLIFQMIS
jgi:hypothetical protein